MLVIRPMMALRLSLIVILAALFAPHGFGQTGPNCDGYGIYASSASASSGSAWVNSSSAEDAGGPFTRDCTVAVTAPKGLHYVKLTFTEWFNAQVSDPWSLCSDPTNCSVSMTWTLTSGETTLDTTTTGGYSGPSPTLPSGPSWTYVGDFNVGTSYESLNYVRTVSKLIDVSSVTASGDATLQWEIAGTEGGICGFGSIDTLLPGDAQLQSFNWLYAVGGPSPGMVAMWQTNADWTEDYLADEGSTQMTQPGWQTGAPGANPEENDPVAYAGGATPLLVNINITRADGISADAVLRIATDQGVLAFPDTTITFTDGTAVFAPPTGTPGQYDGGLAAEDALPVAVANIQPNLTWSIKLDGENFVPFASTQHYIFVTLGPALTFGDQSGPGFPVPARRTTAARVNVATQLLTGMTAPRGCSWRRWQWSNRLCNRQLHLRFQNLGE